MKKLWTLTVVVLFGLAVIIGLVLNSSKIAAPLPIPKPNAYDDFLKAGQMLTPGPTVLDDLGTPALQALVTENGGALSLARAGLQKSCRVPLEYSMNYANNHMADLDNFKRLVRGFLAEGKLAERENRPRDASSNYLAAIRLGHECSRGGVLIDMLVGVACRSIGCKTMEGLRDRLQIPECREAIRQIEALDATADTVTDVVNQERSWSQRTFGWKGRFAALMMRRSMEQSQKKSVAKLPAQQKAERLLLIELAERAYELEKGDRPKTAADLIPAYLKAVPLDPLTGAPLALPGSTPN